MNKTKFEKLSKEEKKELNRLLEIAKKRREQQYSETRSKNRRLSLKDDIEIIEGWQKRLKI